MSMKETKEFHQIRMMQHFKSRKPPAAAALGPELIEFFKQSVAKKQTKLSSIAERWIGLVPPLLCEHCALEGLSRGTLTVVVDSASHLYELKQVLLSGLEKQLLFACKGAGLRKIVLRAGRWYEGDSSSDRRAKFSR
jgi:hypothetical protein